MPQTTSVHKPFGLEPSALLAAALSVAAVSVSISPHGEPGGVTDLERSFTIYNRADEGREPHQRSREQSFLVLVASGSRNAGREIDLSGSWILRSRGRGQYLIHTIVWFLTVISAVRLSAGTAGSLIGTADRVI